MTYIVSQFASTAYGRALPGYPNSYFSVREEGQPLPIALIPTNDLPYGTTPSAIAAAFTRAQRELGGGAGADAVSHAALSALRGKPQDKTATPRPR